MGKRIGGTITFSVNGVRRQAVGSFTHNIGAPIREGKAGADEVHGYTEKPQVPMIEGVITDATDLDLDEFFNLTDATITLEQANDKDVTLYEAWFAGSGNVTTEAGEIECKFEGITAVES